MPPIGPSSRASSRESYHRLRRNPSDVEDFRLFDLRHGSNETKAQGSDGMPTCLADQVACPISILLEVGKLFWTAEKLRTKYISAILLIIFDYCGQRYTDVDTLRTGGTFVEKGQWYADHLASLGDERQS